MSDLGTSEGLAATAFLKARPDRLVCVDLAGHPADARLRAVAGPTQLVFRREDSQAAELEETDLLFVDTTQDGQQLRRELEKHAARVRKYLVLHGTVTFAERGESPGAEGLRSVIEEFLAKGTFRVKSQSEQGQGLMVLDRGM